MKRTLASALVVAFIAPHLVYAVGMRRKRNMSAAPCQDSRKAWTAPSRPPTKAKQSLA